MSKADNLHDFLQDVSDAIKEKKGSSEPINAQSFSEEIRNLPSGGVANGQVTQMRKDSRLSVGLMMTSHTISRMV